MYSPWLLLLLFLSYSSAFCFDLFLTAQTLHFFIFPDRKDTLFLKLIGFIMAEVLYGNLVPKEVVAAAGQNRENCQDSAKSLRKCFGFFLFFFFL